MKKLIFIILFIFSMFIFCACNSKSIIEIKGEYKDMQLVELNNYNFNEIVVKSIYLTIDNENTLPTVLIKKAEKNSIYISCQEGLYSTENKSNKISIKVSNEKLIIKASQFERYNTNADVKIIIECNNITELTLDAINADVDSNVLSSKSKIELGYGSILEMNDCSLYEFKIDISGKSIVKLASVSADKFELGLSGNSSADIASVITDEVEITLSGASDAVIKNGSTLDLDLELSGASTIDTTLMIANKVETTLSGKSNARINAENELEYKLSGGSKLFYYGNPTIDKSDCTKTGSSTVEKMD